MSEDKNIDYKVKRINKPLTVMSVKPAAACLLAAGRYSGEPQSAVSPGCLLLRCVSGVLTGKLQVT